MSGDTTARAQRKADAQMIADKIATLEERGEPVDAGQSKQPPFIVLTWDGSLPKQGRQVAVSHALGQAVKAAREFNKSFPEGTMVTWVVRTSDGKVVYNRGRIVAKKA